MSEPQKATFAVPAVGTIEEQVKRLSERVSQLETNQPLDQDIELTGPYGDPKVHKDPTGWDGESFAGQNYSACPPAFLRLLSGRLKFKSTKEAEDPAKAKYARLTLMDAARALAWAKKIETTVTDF